MPLGFGLFVGLRAGSAPSAKGVLDSGSGITVEVWRIG